MRSYQIVEWGKPLEPRDYPNPEPEGTQVLVRVTACGVCHSDVHIRDGYFDLGNGQRINMAERGLKLPFTLGHEVVGVVAALGPDAEGMGVKVGDRRVVFPWIGCGECDACQSDREVLCAMPRTIGTRRAGGYSDHVLVPDPRYLVPYDGVPTELAATYACSGLTAYSAVKKTGELTERDSLIIIGAGGVGLNGVNFANALTPARVIVADVDGNKRGAARQAGAAETIDNGQPDAVQKALELTNGGAAAVIDFVGAPVTAQFGFDILRRGGTMVMVGLYGGAWPVSVPLFPLKMLAVRGSYVGTLAEFNEMMELVKAGRVTPLPIETRPLARASESLDDLQQGRVVGRVVLKP